jgi:hypothetical protein
LTRKWERRMTWLGRAMKDDPFVLKLWLLVVLVPTIIGGGMWLYGKWDEHGEENIIRHWQIACMSYEGNAYASCLERHGAL